MMAQRKAWSSISEEVGYYRRKAKDAERAAESAETGEARQFFMELAKNFHEAADRAERDAR
jgi:hypothetical protein